MTIKKVDLPPNANHVHYFMHGKTGCGIFEGRRPSTWVSGHLWAIYWKDVTCKECLRHKPRETTKEQYEVLRHSLGLQPRDKSHVRPFRNRYVDEPDAKTPNELIAKGMMEVGNPIDDFGGMCLYVVTKFGMGVAADARKEETNGEG